MSTTTPTMAGLLAPAGAARLVGGGTLGCTTGARLSASYGVQAHPAAGSHQESSGRPPQFVIIDSYRVFRRDA
jgi:hypothetical protein